MGKVKINVNGTEKEFTLSETDEAKVLAIQELTTAIRHLRVSMMGGKK